MKSVKFLALCGLWLLASAAGAQQNRSLTEVAYDDCGENGKQPHLILGENYTMPSLEGTTEQLTCNFGGKVIYAFDKMDIHADYVMEVTFLADSERVIQITSDGSPVCDDIHLPAGKVVKKSVALPRHSFAYGQFVMVVSAAKGPNAIISEIRMLSSNTNRLEAVSSESKQALKSVQSYKVNTNVDAEKVLPVYTPIPYSVKNIYNNKLSLNGVWQFSEKESGEDWHNIQVPGQWSMQGFKVDSAGFARYCRTFEVPQDWEGQEVILRFDGVHSEYNVFINGHKVGSHMGGMTPYEMNITDVLQKGDNELSLTVRSESLADMLGSLTQYAAHQLGGITRKVTMFAVPKVHLSDMRVVTELDDSYSHAKLKVYAAVTNMSDKEVKGVRLNLTLDKHTAAGTLPLPVIEAGKTWKGWMEIEVDNPELWDNEHPNLYTMQLDLYKEGGVLSQIKKRIGFREVQILGNQLLVNGKAVKLRGVCRHEAHPLYGRSLTQEEWKTDAELYRAANCNFIRTSHYPPAEEFIEYCDEMGLFVEVEAPVCWIGHGANANWQKLNYKDKQYYDYVLQADMETVHFYRNHPSVIFWSMANESYWNEGFAQVAEYMKKADTTRPFAFHDQAYGGFNNQGSTAPIANFHYPGPAGCDEAEKSDRPMTFGEYCHLNVYNRSELVTDPGIRSDWALALQPMWERMYATQGVLGGSIWSGIDDIFQLPDGNAVGYGAWGPIDGWRRPKPEYWDMKKIYSPVKVYTESLDPSGRLVVCLENRYTFTDLNEVKVNWRFGKENGVAQLNLPPHQKGELVVEVSDPDAANQLELEFIDPRGFVADEYSIPVGEQKQNKLETPASLATKVRQNRSQFVVTGKDFLCRIDRTTGTIVSLEKGGRKILSGGPWLMVLPLVSGGCYPNHNAATPPFNDLCKEWKAASVSTGKEGENVWVKVSGAYADFDGAYTLTMNANGEVRIDYAFTAKADVNPRQWGMVFETYEGFDEVFWRRKGLWNVYPADHISRPTGSAVSFYEEVPENPNPRVKPTWAWSKDFNQLGSNDFRSTRRNIWYAGLKAGQSSQVVAVSDGNQHWRCWKEGKRSRFLIADFVTAGDEMFLASHYAPYRKPLKKGDVIKGNITLRVN